MTKKLLYLILLALAIRLAIVYFQYSGDIGNHLAWGQSILSSETWGFYARHFPGFNDANYPPVAILSFAFFRFLYQTINSFLLWQNFNIKFLPSSIIPLFATLNMQAAFLKLPSIIADLGIGYLIFALTKKKLLALLYLFNPAVIYVSAVWGQIESVTLFFLLLSYFFLTGKKNRPYLSHLAFALALLTKQTALWLLPVFMILWIKKGNLKTLLQGVTLQLIIFILFYLPFLSPLFAFPAYLSTLSGSSTLVSDQAMNLWYFIVGGRRVEDSSLLLGLSFRLWSILLLSVAGFTICIRFWKNFSDIKAAESLFLISLIAFFLQTRVHERHLAPAVLFLLLTDYQPKYKILFYSLLSAYYMYNLYFSLRLPFI